MPISHDFTSRASWSPIRRWPKWARASAGAVAIGLASAYAYHSLTLPMRVIGLVPCIDALRTPMSPKNKSYHQLLCAFRKQYEETPWQAYQDPNPPKEKPASFGIHNGG